MKNKEQHIPSMSQQKSNGDLYSSFQEELEAEGYEYTPLSSNEQETLIEEGDKKKKHLKLVE